MPVSSVQIQPLVDVVVAAEFLSRSVNSMYIDCREGKIPHYRVGNSIRFDLDELKAWLEEEPAWSEGRTMSPPEMRRPRHGSGADADSTPDQPPDTIADDAAEDDPGFWRKALSGKVRPAPREPKVSHDCRSCCRWSA